ncbi:DUF92 domain-containing protein, partial [Roseisolibacter sp. H3M3-2]|uniref:DUF92 domain-containing protein n=1 Tax=Roseisolibacter sp. H3M3-2 TaxID=3031323 RepID=UPI0023DCC19F
AGLLLAAGIALPGRRAGALAADGAVAAVVVGTAAMAAGWGWGALLILFFATGSALSRWRRREREARTGDVVAKGGPRDAAQVLANGGLFAALALAAGWSPAWSGAAAAALAAAAADTWATEVGTLVGGTPRTVPGWRPVAPGTSGAVTAAGTLAMLAGAGVVALAALALRLPAG